jgi:hypothetical protein
MLTRREVIRNLIVSVGGSSLLSACGGRVTLETLAPSAEPRFYGDREMALLSRMSDLILPRTETPGALDVQVPALLDKLMAEWANAETRTEHRAALAALDAELGARAGGDFLVAPDAAAEQTLAALDRDAFTGDGLEGYRGLKGLITQMYFATEGGAVDELGWVGVPGRWDPCVDRGGNRG